MASKKKKNQGGDAQSHRYRILRIGIGLTFFVVFLQIMGQLNILELKTVDMRFKLRGIRTPVLKAAIVAIDDESLNGWGDEKNDYHTMPERWVWPRTFYATVIDNLREAGARFIAFDVVYSESTHADPKQDRAFADAAKKAGNVVFAERYVRKDSGAWKTETVITVLDNAKRDKGHIMTNLTEDGFLRSYLPLYINSKPALDPTKQSIDLALFRQILFGKDIALAYDDAKNVVKVGDKEIPLSEGGQLYVNYAGGTETFPTFPFHKVYYKDMDMSVFKDRVVYVGSTSEILHDNWPTPFSATNRMPGVETHAHALDTMLSGAYLRLTPWWVIYTLIVGLGLMTSFLTFRVKPLHGAAVMGLIFAIYLVLGFFAFAQQGIVLPLAAPLASVFLSFSGIAVYRGVVEEQKARSTRAMFSRYVSHQIVDEILKNPGAVELGGQEKEVSILFSDIRGFTAMSEKLTAPEVVTVLNEYLTRMVDIVISNNGTLDKFVGDAVMAVRGSPLADPQHQTNSVRSAVEMMEALQILRKKWKEEGKPEIDIGIGVHTGVVVAGNMGHPAYKMDYTVIGDDVNLAARLESANKELKAHILISGGTYAAVEGLVDVIKHPDIHVKGKEKAVEVYEVIGWKGQGRADWAVPLKG